jgi:hypothetical protein
MFDVGVEELAMKMQKLWECRKQVERIQWVFDVGMYKLRGEGPWKVLVFSLFSPQWSGVNMDLDASDPITAGNHKLTGGGGSLKLNNWP